MGLAWACSAPKWVPVPSPTLFSSSTYSLVPWNVILYKLPKGRCMRDQNTVFCLPSFALVLDCSSYKILCQKQCLPFRILKASSRNVACCCWEVWCHSHTKDWKWRLLIPLRKFYRCSFIRVCIFTLLCLCPRFNFTLNAGLLEEEGYLFFFFFLVTISFPLSSWLSSFGTSIWTPSSNFQLFSPVSKLLSGKLPQLCLPPFLLILLFVSTAIS